jgi:hypothetical protein
VYLYLAFTRFGGNGSVFASFELNQDARTWTNSAGSTIPCRTTGELLIAFEESGNATSVYVDRWVTDTAASNGCATTGHLLAASDITPDVEVRAAFTRRRRSITTCPVTSASLRARFRKPSSAKRRST